MWKNAGIISHSGVLLWLGDVTCSWKLLWLLVKAGTPKQNPDCSDAAVTQVGQWQPLKDLVQIHPHLLDQFHIIHPLNTGFRVVQKPTVYIF